MENFSIDNLFHSTSLYDELNFPDDYQQIFEKLFIETENLQFDSFCIHCEKESTFRCSDKMVYNDRFTNFHTIISRNLLAYWNSFTKPIHLNFDCQRDNEHKYSIMFISEGGNKLVKVGQYPSIATIEQHNIKNIVKC